jgi:acyl phosphate:glycerol-3-phosphate acyltransferase
VSTWIALIILAYLCGSIPFGLLLARARGIDIRQHGSGNIGATNVGRVLGSKLGTICFALDLLKGFAPTLAAGLVIGLVHNSLAVQPIKAIHAWLWMAVMASAVLGHIYSPWLGFRGGKGVATGLGAMLGVFPYLTIPALAALSVWLVAAAIWRYVSLASCLAAVALPFLVLLWGGVISEVWEKWRLQPGFWPFVAVTAVLAVLVIVKHRGNIQRLIAGTENRMGAHSASPSAR